MRISDWSSDVCSSDLLARLEIHGAVLDLEDDVGGERAVERLELAIRLPGAVLGIVGRIDEGAPDDDAVVRAKRGGKHVGALGMAAVIVAGAGLAFRIGLDEEAAERSEEHTSELQSLMRISYAV